jgi:hypothetical protein
MANSSVFLHSRNESSGCGKRSCRLTFVKSWTKTCYPIILKKLVIQIIYFWREIILHVTLKLPFLCVTSCIYHIQRVRMGEPHLYANCNWHKGWCLTDESQVLEMRDVHWTSSYESFQFCSFLFRDDSTRTSMTVACMACVILRVRLFFN